MERAQQPVITFASYEMGQASEDLPTQVVALCVACGWAHYDLPKVQSLFATCSEVFTASDDCSSLVGCCFRTSYAAARRNDAGFGMLGMMLVDPKLRGAGIAKQLLSLFKERVEGLGETCGMGCATDLGLPVYLKHGYRPATEGSTSWRVSAVCADVAADLAEQDFEASVALYTELAAQEAALNEFIDFDAEVSGLDRSAQLRHLTTMEGACLAIATTRAGTLGALLSIVDSQTGALNVGPILGTEAAATRLLRALAQANADKRMVLFVLDHQEYVESLEAYGFTAAPTPMTGSMVMGARPLPGDRSKYIGMISPALG